MTPRLGVPRSARDAEGYVNHVRCLISASATEELNAAQSHGASGRAQPFSKPVRNMSGNATIVNILL
jgi:hypothetical protein